MFSTSVRMLKASLLSSAAVGDSDSSVKEGGAGSGASPAPNSKLRYSHFLPLLESLKLVFSEHVQSPKAAHYFQRVSPCLYHCRKSVDSACVVYISRKY